VAVADAGGDGLLLAAGPDKLTTWYGATGQLHKSWTAGHGELHAAACSGDHRKVYTAGRDGMVRVWDVATAQLLHAWRAHRTPVRAIALVADDTLITAGQDGQLIVWSAPEGTRKRALVGGGTPIHCLAAAAGRVAAGTADGQIRLWSTSGQPLNTLAAHRQEVTALVFYANAARLASCSADATARIWDISHGRCLATIRPQQGPIRQICVSPDEQTLATTGYKLVLWDAVTGQERSVMTDPPGFVSCAAFSPDGRRLITGYDNGAVRLRRLPARRAAEGTGLDGIP
jgi:WD40 repeat protein